MHTIGSAPSSFNGGLFFALASLGNNGRNHPNKLACFGWLQIKHAVFDCKVHKQKPHVKVGLFRMVTACFGWLLRNYGLGRWKMKGCDTTCGNVTPLVLVWMGRGAGAPPISSVFVIRRALVCGAAGLFARFTRLPALRRVLRLRELLLRLRWLRGLRLQLTFCCGVCG